MVKSPSTDVLRSVARRDFLARAASGTAIAAMGGGAWYLSDSLTREARAQTRADGRPRLPPGQRVIESLKPMGGTPGDPNPRAFRLKIHGEVNEPKTLTFKDLLGLDVVEHKSDVHCVTGWSMLDGKWTGVRIKELARLVGVKPSAHHIVFEAAHGYTANARLDEGLADDVMVTWRLNDRPLGRAHGPPVRGLIPGLYFWKSAKWLTGIRFTRRDEPGYWEVRGYNNHADPWLEERYA